MPITREQVIEALASIPDPQRSGDIVSLDRVAKVAICDGFVNIKVEAPAMDRQGRDDLRSQITSVVKKIGHEISNVNVEFSGPINEGANAAGDKPAPAPQPQANAEPSKPKQAAPQGQPAVPGAPKSPQENARDTNPLPRVKQIIAVGAGKGGVGKSTVSVNLAVGLARQGLKVGLLDADIYGPSAPTLLGLADKQLNGTQNTIFPFEVHGIKAMTIGKMVEEDKPLIWRGPMAHGAFQQLLTQTEWGDLDYLIIDLPPGTGDVPLTMAQLIPLTGAVIVCTPQKVAQDDAVRAVGMFTQLGIPVLGVVENMSYFIADDGKEYDIFGKGGAAQMAQQLGLESLGMIPINMQLRANSDSGNPTANYEAKGTLGTELKDMSDKVKAAADERAESTQSPTLSIH